MADKRFETGLEMVIDALAILVAEGDILQEQAENVIDCLGMESMAELSEIYHNIESLQRKAEDIKAGYLYHQIYAGSALQYAMRLHVPDQHVRRRFIEAILGTYPQK